MALGVEVLLEEGDHYHASILKEGGCPDQGTESLWP